MSMRYTPSEETRRRNRLAPPKYLSEPRSGKHTLPDGTRKPDSPTKKIIEITERIININPTLFPTEESLFEAIAFIYAITLGWIKEQSEMFNVTNSENNLIQVLHESLGHKWFPDEKKTASAFSSRKKSYNTISPSDYVNILTLHITESENLGVKGFPNTRIAEDAYFYAPKEEQEEWLDYDEAMRQWLSCVLESDLPGKLAILATDIPAQNTNQLSVFWRTDNSQVIETERQLREEGKTVTSLTINGYCPTCHSNFKITVLNINTEESWSIAAAQCPQCGTCRSACQYEESHRKLQQKAGCVIISILAIAIVILAIVLL